MSAALRTGRGAAGRRAGIGGRRPPRRVLPAVVTAVILASVLVLAPSAAAFAFAASPTPSPETGSDTRSAGQGPGLVGAPGAAVLAVAVIAVLAIGLTLLYIRLTAPPSPRS